MCKNRLGDLMDRSDKFLVCMWAVALLLDIACMVYDIVQGGDNIAYWVDIILLTVVILTFYFRIHYMQKTIDRLRTENWLHQLTEWQLSGKTKDE